MRYRRHGLVTQQERRKGLSMGSTTVNSCVVRDGHANKVSNPSPEEVVVDVQE